MYIINIGHEAYSLHDLLLNTLFLFWPGRNRAWGRKIGASAAHRLENDKCRAKKKKLMMKVHQLSGCKHATQLAKFHAIMS